MKAMKGTGLKAAIVQDSDREGLLEGTYRAGIEKPLIFMPVLDVQTIGSGAQGIFIAKEEFGMPTGTAPIGVIGRWSKVEELGHHAKTTCRAGAAALVQAMGANFIIYGSVAKARFSQSAL